MVANFGLYALFWVFHALYWLFAENVPNWNVMGGAAVPHIIIKKDTCFMDSDNFTTVFILLHSLQFITGENHVRIVAIQATIKQQKPRWIINFQYLSLKI